VPTQVAVNTKVEESIAFARDRRSLDRSVWYSGHLMTFLATAEDTQGKFALIEAVARKGNVPPPHIHHREEETFYVLEGEMTFSVGGQTIKATPGTMVCLPLRSRPSASSKANWSRAGSSPSARRWR